MKKIIYNELMKLKGGIQRKGFEYIVSAIQLIYANPQMGTIKLYCTIANEFNDTPERVERSMRYYLQCLMREGDKKEIDKLNLALNKHGVPKVTEFLKAFAVYLKINY